MATDHYLMSSCTSTVARIQTVSQLSLAVTVKQARL